MLNLERYESGRQKLNTSVVQLNELVTDSIETIRALAQEKKARLETRIPDTMFLISCDEDLIRQVMTNLVGNAIKFIDSGGSIRISIFPNHDEVQVWVEDDGKGISPELHELIFDKFFQARNQTLKKPEGSGLGLAICKKIIDMHGGKIWVESSENKGARFIFTLPINLS